MSDLDNHITQLREDVAETTALLALLQTPPPLFVAAHVEPQIKKLRAVLRRLGVVKKEIDVRRVRDLHDMRGVTKPLFLLDGWFTTFGRLSNDRDQLLGEQRARGGAIHEISDLGIKRLQDAANILFP